MVYSNITQSQSGPFLYNVYMQDPAGGGFRRVSSLSIAISDSKQSKVSERNLNNSYCSYIMICIPFHISSKKIYTLKNPLVHSAVHLQVGMKATFMKFKGNPSLLPLEQRRQLPISTRKLLQVILKSQS